MSCRADDLKAPKLIMSESGHTCPGCGLVMPPSDSAAYDGYYNTSPECWSLYSEVLAEEYSNAVLWGQVHQLTVDAYAVQHAGGPHPDKSVGIHLSGLYLMLEQDASPPEVSSFHKQLARSIEEWPDFDPPSLQDDDRLTVMEVALAASVAEHIERSREWANQVWNAWTPCHDRVAELVANHLDQSAHPSGER
jgi:hypothetical protein